MNNVIKIPKEGIFNIGSGKGLKLIELFEMAFEVFEISFKKSHIISKKHNLSFSQILDIKLAQQTYDFKPEYTMKTWFLDSINKK